jgi:hypothetical protein
MENPFGENWLKEVIGDDPFVEGKIIPAKSIEVLNGRIFAGDMIAYATRFSSSMDMKIAIVLEISEKEHPYFEDRTVPIATVRVIKASDQGFAAKFPYVTKIRVFDRVVKL